MLNMQLQTVGGATHAYHIFGNGKINLVIEMGLGATAGEWWHIAERLSQQNTVLLYERSQNTSATRTPLHIAQELFSLLQHLPCEEKIILVAHSQGGLYAQQFARLYPQMISGLILIDPLSANDNHYKELLSPSEQKKSGFDKTSNLAVMEKLAKCHLGSLIKAIMKSAPPFYYYKDFSTEARNYILLALTKASLYTTALAEYRLAHEEDNISSLKTKTDFPNIPLVLITHTPSFSIDEIINFGHTSLAFAQKVDAIWQSLMEEYLTFSTSTTHLQAKNSGHFIHLTEPDLIDEGLEWIKLQI